MTQVRKGTAFRDTLAQYLLSLVDKRDFAAVLECYDQNRDAIDGGGDARAGICLHQVAKAHASLGAYPHALRSARTAQNLLAKHGDQLELAEVFATLGGILRDMGKFKEAQTAFGDAESIFRRTECPEGQCRALNHLAGLHYRQGEFRTALRHLMEALEIARRLDDQRKVAYMLGNVGRIHTFVGDLDEAQKHLELNLELSVELGDPVEAARARYSLGYTYILRGEWSQAEELVKTARRECHALGLTKDEAISLSYLGEIRYRQGDLKGAWLVLQEASEVAGRAGRRSTLLGRIARHQSEVARLQGKLQQAKRLMAKAMAALETSDNKVELGALKRLAAMLAQDEKNNGQARRLFFESLDILDETGVKLEKAATLVAAGQCDAFTPRQRLTYLFRADELFTRCGLEKRALEVDRLIQDIDDSAERWSPRPARSKLDPEALVDRDYMTNAPSIIEFKQRLPLLNKLDLPLLLTGETGVGKDRMARYYHSVVRPDGPYVAINCASVPETLLESELFGYVRGAFTGADRDKPGLFVQASGGVLLLDEIGDMPLSLQAKLLNVLDERKLLPLGGVEEIPLDFRLVAATNQNLQEMVEAGQFRRDLYYRLTGFDFEIPPLRRRKEDIPLLMAHFLRHYGLLEKGQEIPAELVRQFVAHSWPGNTRDLDHRIKRMAVMRGMVADGDLVELARILFQAEQPREHLTLFERVEKFERRLLKEALISTAGNKSEAARILGIHEATVRTKLKRYGISLEGGVPN